MDRLSRDQEDIAGLFKRMAFSGVKIVTLSEGDVTHLHVGLKGTMNALFLKDLADKVRRGLRGRVEGGKSGGGNCYGYDVVKKFAADGELVRGDRAINKFEACVVRRIFSNYASGKSPKRIAFELNKEGIKAPGGGDWGFSTINGNRRRGTGILNNEMSAGSSGTDYAISRTRTRASVCRGRTRSRSGSSTTCPSCASLSRICGIGSRDGRRRSRSNAVPASRTGCTSGNAPSTCSRD
jgi:Recombinase